MRSATIAAPDPDRVGEVVGEPHRVARCERRREQHAARGPRAQGRERNERPPDTADRLGDLVSGMKVARARPVRTRPSAGRRAACESAPPPTRARPRTRRSAVPARRAPMLRRSSHSCGSAPARRMPPCEGGGRRAVRDPLARPTRSTTDAGRVPPRPPARTGSASRPRRDATRGRRPRRSGATRRIRRRRGGRRRGTRSRRRGRN